MRGIGWAACAAAIIAAPLSAVAAPAGEKPAGETPVKQAPVKQEPVKQDLAAECPAQSRGPLDRDKPDDLAAASSAAEAAKGKVALGRAARLQLIAQEDVAFIAAPGKAGDAAGFAGLAQFEAPAAGNYRVGLTAPAWIDVIGAAGAPLASVAHGHGPQCSGIAKMVDFTLERGLYTLQIAASRQSEITVVVTSLP